MLFRCSENRDALPHKERPCPRAGQTGQTGQTPSNARRAVLTSPPPPPRARAGGVCGEPGGDPRPAGCGAGGLSREGVYSRDIGRGNSREGGGGLSDGFDSRAAGGRSGLAGAAARRGRRRGRPPARSHPRGGRAELRGAAPQPLCARFAPPHGRSLSCRYTHPLRPASDKVCERAVGLGAPVTNPYGGRGAACPISTG